MSKMQTSANQIGNQTYQSPNLGQRPTTDLVQYLKDYARSKPESAALWCFGIGFVLGWKLKPW
jgi:hypothetical protein